uniref:Myb-like domain-containing protein n=1 Tax=Oncorhynchus tshawytscha TaxID=74940 RepID=A0AAZ3SJF9_ONCTS
MWNLLLFPGLSLRSGRFNAQENERLKSNVYDFLSLTGIQSGSRLFHPQRFKEEEANIKKLKFFIHITSLFFRIPRPWHQIYIRGRKMFDGSNYKDYSFNILTLTSLPDILLHSSFGEMVVSANKGVWTEEELKRLMEAVRKHLVGQAEPGSGPATVRKDQLYNNIPWTDVCQTVETRHWSQCRIKWWAGSFRGSCCKIKPLDVTPRYVQTHYYRLKVANVPLWQSMSFCGRCKLLSYKHYPLILKSRAVPLLLYFLFIGQDREC